MSIESNDKQSAESKFRKLFSEENEYYPYVEAVLENIPFTVFISDENGVALYANRFYYNRTQRDPVADRVIGEKVSDLSSHNIVPGVLKEGTPRYGVKKMLSDDVSVYIDVAPVIVEQKIVGTVSCGHDLELERLRKENLSLAQKNTELKKKIHSAYAAKYTFSDFLGENERIIQAKKFGQKFANSSAPVLITGESGCGKEIFAQAIHNAGTRASAPFVSVNCATLDQTLMSSELFGYEAGAFTGANKGGKMGLFEAADGGTLFLDEISELNAESQSKLLRVLQEGTIRKVGGTKEQQVNVRVLAATNTNLEKMVELGKFRADLYYRLNVLTIQLPPLRERTDDIIRISERLLENNLLNDTAAHCLSQDAVDLLMLYSWPGNVRELKNAITYAVTVCETKVITANDFPEPIIRACQQATAKKTEDPGGPNAHLIDGETLEEMERRIIRQMVDTHGDSAESKALIAKQLGISLSTLYNKLKTK